MTDELILVNDDCIKVMAEMDDNSVDLTLADIPYDAVNRESNGLRTFDKGKADVATFDLAKFLEEVNRVTRGTVIIFCGKEQFSDVFEFFADKKGTVRQGVWIKSNPMPSNGQYVYLSGVENFVWFKKPGATFNAHCKNPALVHPNGSSRIHPTEKNHELLRELILDNSNAGDLVFDPCAGSASTLLVARQEGRRSLGVELDAEFYRAASERLIKEGASE